MPEYEIQLERREVQHGWITVQAATRNAAIEIAIKQIAKHGASVCEDWTPERDISRPPRVTKTKRIKEQG